MACLLTLIEKERILFDLIGMVTGYSIERNGTFTLVPKSGIRTVALLLRIGFSRVLYPVYCPRLEHCDDRCSCPASSGDMGYCADSCERNAIFYRSQRSHAAASFCTSQLPGHRPTTLVFRGNTPRNTPVFNRKR